MRHDIVDCNKVHCRCSHFFQNHYRNNRIDWLDLLDLNIHGCNRSHWEVKASIRCFPYPEPKLRGPDASHILESKPNQHFGYKPNRHSDNLPMPMVHNLPTLDHIEC